MNTHLKKFILPILFLLNLLVIGCEKSPNTIDTTPKQEFIINSGDLLNINLGTFGDEEGADIYFNPLHAKINKIDQPVNSLAIYYQYMPQGNFAGKDSVKIITFTKSDGTLNAEKLDTIRFIFVVRR